MRRRRRRLSFVRTVAALALIAVAAAAATILVPRVVAGVDRAAAHGPWYAPYVDATLTPTYPFEDENSNPSNDVVLGFIVASREGNCVPTWGTYFDLKGAATSLDLDRRIVRLRQRGGDVIVSFGGVANDELALHCDEQQLERAYAAVIDRYRPTTIDFDLEGASLANTAANERRAAAVRALQQRARAKHRRLAVWLTLPTTPDGLDDAAVGELDAMLQGKVDLAGLNLLTMDYGNLPPGEDMVQATTNALNAAARQLDGAYRRAGLLVAPSSLWQKLGMTPMIGQNDTPDEQITLADAQRLLALARTKHIGRVSIWSLNRDTPCGAQLDLGTLSNLCSGVSQKPLAFTGIFARLPGRAGRAQQVVVGPLRTQQPDDPAHSPYPIWSEAQVYTAGQKVTWHHNVYEAKWWTNADVPDAPVVHEWDTPWRYLGPVLPGDHPAPPLPKGTYPAWRGTKVYVKGDRVEMNGVGYQARWWTQGDPPNLSSGPYGSPWQQLPPASELEPPPAKHRP